MPGAAVVAYAVSRSVGLPQIGDDVGDWADPLGIVAVGSELLLAGVAAAVLLGVVDPSPRPRRWPAVVATPGLLQGVSATAVAAAAERGDGTGAHGPWPA